MKERSQLKNQLAAVVCLFVSMCLHDRRRCVCLLTIERHLARVFSGNNSPVTTQAAGPKLDAKNDT